MNKMSIVAVLVAAILAGAAFIVDSGRRFEWILSKWHSVKKNGWAWVLLLCIGTLLVADLIETPRPPSLPGVLEP